MIGASAIPVAVGLLTTRMFSFTLICWLRELADPIIIESGILLHCYSLLVWEPRFLRAGIVRQYKLMVV